MKENKPLVHLLYTAERVKEDTHCHLVVEEMVAFDFIKHLLK